MRKVKHFAEHHRVTREPAVGPVFGSIMLGVTFASLRWVSFHSTRATNTQIKRKQNAARRMSSDSGAAPYGRGSRRTRRARLTAFHRGTCGREPTPPLSSRTRFLERGQTVGVTRLPPIPVQRQSRRPVIMPTGRFPVSRPGAEVTSPARGNRSCPIGRCHPADVLWWARFTICTPFSDECQALGLCLGDRPARANKRRLSRR